MTRAHEWNGDLRQLQQTPPEKFERRELEGPEPNPSVFETPNAASTSANAALQISGAPPIKPAVAAPTPLITFAGLDFATWGAGHPPDTNGDVGPNHYIETVNTSIGIFNKSTGAQITAFTFNTFMSQGSFGNLCDTNNFGDPVVVYDTFEDRWVISDFAFTVNGSGTVNSNVYQCFAASKTGDPVGGGWNFYSLVTSDVFPDYPKFGVWPDAIYYSANCFGPGTGGSSFQNVRVYALNKMQMYAGAPSIQSVSFNAPSGEFTVLPANARLQTGSPPLGSPNYFGVVWQFLNVVSVYKFHVDWNRISLSTFTGPFMSTDTNWWEQLASANQTAPSPANRLDELYARSMVQNQYSNLSGVESLWMSHTVGAGNPGAANVTATQSAVRYYQVKVTGGTVEANPTQAWTHSPADTLWRFMPSVAVDNAGDMAIGYSTSNATTNPAINYAGRLAGDPLNSITQTEQLMFQGTGSQSGNCGSGTCIRWGDYSAMTLDPDGCTFWYANEYYATTGLNDLTRIGSFRYPSCTPVGAGGTLQGTVFDSVTTSPISGATISFGSRTTTTNVSGVYSFTSIPAGTYPTETASAPGYNSSTTNTIVVTDGGTTVKDFPLSTQSASGCPVDTTQADFQLGVATNTDLTTSPGDVTLSIPTTVDQANTAGTTTGTGFGTPNWTGQTFIPAVTGSLVKADVTLFCNGCGGTPPNLTLSVRNTSAGLPTGADLATATIPGSTFASGASTTFTASFGSPATLTSGTQYALILRPVSAPSGSGYFWIRSSPSTYANGQRVLSADSGATWSSDSTRDYNFKTYMQTGYAASGNLISGLKDNNPGGGFFGHWTTFSWTASTPANTSINFQVAGSNSQYGPFNFIGPDGTAGTFFNSPGANLYPLLGNVRYMKYKAYLATTNSAATPTLNDVTTCYSNTNAPTAANGSVTGTITDAAGAPVSGATISLSGNESREAITDSSGKYSFDGVETNGFYTVTPSRANYSFSPANRSFSLLGVHTEASFTASANNDHANAIDTTEFFVRQQYLDFPGREPDPQGFNGWVSMLRNCAAGDTSCDRVHVSESFYRSAEFQDRGYFAYRFYTTALGRKPDYAEFMPDLQQVSGFLTSAQLEAAKNSLAEDFARRPEFVGRYGSLSNAAYVDALMSTAGVTLANRQTLIDSLNNGAATHAQVLRQIAESADVYQKYYNQAFVVLEYFGYLRRDPDAAYLHWIQVLDANPADSRRMVEGFVDSTEYRNRFNQ